MPNDTIHEEIENWLAADVHDQLNHEERAAFQQHLAGCATCRALQEEEKNMHQLLENTLVKESADPAFEERMVRHFRDRAPAPGGGLLALLNNLMRLRAVQLTAAAAVLLTLVQVGKMVTGEGQALSRANGPMALASPMVRDEKKSELGQIAAALNAPAEEEAMPLAKTFRSTDTLASTASEGLKSDKSAKPAAPPATVDLRQKEKDLEDRSDAGATGERAK